MKSFKLKKCMKCGALVRVYEDCNCGDCGISCCGEPMVGLTANSTDAAVEKHVPCYEIVGENIVVHVNHVMEEEHHIEWIMLASKDVEEIKYLNDSETAEVTFPNVQSGTIYAYCNKHGLWSKDISK